MPEKHKDIIILAIESSCDDTSAAVFCNNKKRSNVISGQHVHRAFGGVVPELASRAHLQHIVPVVDQALQKAGITAKEVDAVAFTRGPGLLGSLLVGVSFAKAFALARHIPLIEVNHMKAHILAHFIEEEGADPAPEFPFLCLTVSGGHTQIVQVNSYEEMEVLGQTIDDAAGEAFDKIAKILGLPYPGGPLIDKHAATGNPDAFSFSEPKVQGYDFSFSGLKTGVLYFVQKEMQKNPNFISDRLHDICASVQNRIVTILIKKLRKAAFDTGINRVVIAGGVSANSGLRKALKAVGDEAGWQVRIPKFEYCTDNAAMIAVTGYYKYLEADFSDQGVVPDARLKMQL